MIVPRVFKSRQRKRKNISIVLSSHKRGKRLYDACRVLFFCHLPVRVLVKKVHDNSADRLDSFVNRRFDSFTLYIREFLISSVSYVILSMNERSVKLETNNQKF